MMNSENGRILLLFVAWERFCKRRFSASLRHVGDNARVRSEPAKQYQLFNSASFSFTARKSRQAKRFCAGVRKR